MGKYNFWIAAHIFYENQSKKIISTESPELETRESFAYQGEFAR